MRIGSDPTTGEKRTTSYPSVKKFRTEAREAVLMVIDVLVFQHMGRDLCKSSRGQLSEKTGKSILLSMSQAFNTINGNMKIAIIITTIIKVIRSVK